MLLGRSAGFSIIAGFLKFASAAIFCVAISPAFLFSADTYPSYSVLSIVNAATQTAEALAPNTIATIYGTNLSFTTGAAAQSGSTLPVTMEGVTVYVNGLFGHLFFVSPTQINFLIPYELIAGTVTIEVARQGAAGPSVKIQLNSASPGMFPWNGNCAIATHLDRTLISPDSPAKAGEIIVVFAVGLGRVSPDTSSGRLATSAAAILTSAQLQILIAGAALPPSNVLYAGLAPGYAGLYQINLRLPDILPANPEIRISVAGQLSPAAIQLPTLASAPPANPPAAVN